MAQDMKPPALVVIVFVAVAFDRGSSAVVEVSPLVLLHGGVSPINKMADHVATTARGEIQVVVPLRARPLAMLDGMEIAAVILRIAQHGCRQVNNLGPDALERACAAVREADGGGLPERHGEVAVHVRALCADETRGDALLRRGAIGAEHATEGASTCGFVPPSNWIVSQVSNRAASSSGASERCRAVIVPGFLSWSAFALAPTGKASSTVSVTAPVAG